ncbi:alpha/beta hydrolase [Streptomyces sp. SID11385]|nr:alpha/beta hydrolase [Streptomyces sp. SID11385]
MLVLVLLVVLSGCSGGGSGGEQRGNAGPASPSASAPPSASASPSPGLPRALTGQKLAWQKCGATEGYAAPGREWRCAKLTVPVDWAKPTGETLRMAVIRSAATGERRGSLVFNFGGPGGSGVSLLPLFAPGYGALHRAYDLVSFDPRGVGGSARVDCRDDAAVARAERAVDLTPDTPAEERAFLADASAFGKSCARTTGALLPELTTANTARDLDLLRTVLGEAKFDYFGVSYGTELGGTYAHLFPRHVGRMVLDAVVDPAAGTVEHAKGQARGFQRALNAYFRSLDEDPKAGTAKVAALLKDLDAHPLPAGRGRELTESLAVTGLVSPLYSEASWPQLTRALDAAGAGDGGPLLALADSYNDRTPDGHYGKQAQAQRAISCADDSTRPTAAQARARLAEFRAISPVFGPFLGWDTAGWCHDWPTRGDRTTPEVSAPGAPPILVVGNTGDPATPFEGAAHMARELGKGVGVELIWHGEGHGAYGSGSTCVDDTVNAYLLRGSVPRPGKECH